MVSRLSEREKKKERKREREREKEREREEEWRRRSRNVSSTSIKKDIYHFCTSHNLFFDNLLKKVILGYLQ